MTTLYEPSNESKSLVIEATSREGFPVRLVLTLRKLGVVTMLDYFLSVEETQQLAKALRG